jgi:drug/metabolite transporter (DMT)-like permease
MTALFILLTVVFTVVGQLLVKYGMLRVGASPTQMASWPQFLLRTLTNPGIVAGLACAVLAAVSWMVALSRSELSFAYPFMTLAIVLVLALSGLLFGERVSLVRWLGVAVVCLGLVIAARG